MKPFRLTLRDLFWLVLLCTLGCGFGKQSARYARVNDCTIPWSPEVVSVDGQPPKRQSHPLITVLPLVQLPPGTHTIRVTHKKDAESGLEEEEITTTVEADKEYRIVRTDDNGFGLAEMQEAP